MSKASFGWKSIGMVIAQRDNEMMLCRAVKLGRTRIIIFCFDATVTATIIIITVSLRVGMVCVRVYGQMTISEEMHEIFIIELTNLCEK